MNWIFHSTNWCSIIIYIFSFSTFSSIISSFTFDLRAIAIGYKVYKKFYNSSPTLFDNVDMLDSCEKVEQLARKVDL